LVREFKPDLCHAFPLPIEGYVAGLIDFHPLIISSWGQDLVGFCPRTRLHRYLARRAFRVADGYTADCERDIRLAGEMGFDVEAKPAAVFPGNGGVDLRMRPGQKEVAELRRDLGADANSGIVLYPRGVRQYVRLDTVWKAIPLVLERRPNTKFVLMGLEGHSSSELMAQQSPYADAVVITGYVGKDDFSLYVAAADAMISPSTNDGTSMTLLESMALGAFPIVSDIESNRDWITDGKNGFLVDPGDASALAEATCTALGNADLRLSAARINREIVEKRADYSTVMPRVEQFYKRVLQSAPPVRAGANAKRETAAR
jgi:glycosyltransferase involved in cell wall biosynthesis